MMAKWAPKLSARAPEVATWGVTAGLLTTVGSSFNYRARLVFPELSLLFGNPDRWRRIPWAGCAAWFARACASDARGAVRWNLL